MHQLFKLLICLSLLLVTCACSAPQQPLPLNNREDVAWPAAPLRPKIKWVRNISSPEDIGLKKSFWDQVKEFFVGEEQINIVKPYGVHVDQEGRIFVVDTGSARVHIFDERRHSYQAIGGDDVSPLKSPICAIRDDLDNLYISDSAVGTVFRYNLTDKTLQPFTKTPLQRPTGLGFNPSKGWFYVAETAAHRIVVLDRQGVQLFTFGQRGGGPGEFNFPTDLWVDEDGWVYVTDALNARIQIFTAKGEQLEAFGEHGDTPGTFAKPKGITVDPHGHIYVCDALFDAIQIFDQEGSLLMAFGETGDRPGEFWMPSGIFATLDGYIYVTDTYNKRIQVFQHLRCKPGLDENCIFD